MLSVTSAEYLKGKMLPLDGAIVMLFNLLSVIMWMAWNLHPCPPKDIAKICYNKVLCIEVTSSEIVIHHLYLHEGWVKAMLSAVILSVCRWMFKTSLDDSLPLLIQLFVGKVMFLRNGIHLSQSAMWNLHIHNTFNYPGRDAELLKLSLWTVS